jgi:hypothetical protein
MDESPRSLVAYYRVSTAQQGVSGLRLEGQVDAVDWVPSHCGSRATLGMSSAGGCATRW